MSCAVDNCNAVAMLWRRPKLRGIAPDHRANPPRSNVRVRDYGHKVLTKFAVVSHTDCREASSDPRPCLIYRRTALAYYQY